MAGEQDYFTFAFNNIDIRKNGRPFARIDGVTYDNLTQEGVELLERAVMGALQGLQKSAKK
jgi:hypothetical protein